MNDLVSCQLLSNGRSKSVAVFVAVLLSLGIGPVAFGQSSQISTEPLKTIIPVQLDPSTGDISVGSAAPFHGANPGLHLLALSRNPDSSHLDMPDVVADNVFTDAGSANQFLQNILAGANNDALIIANGVGNYGFAVSAIANNLDLFGAQVDLEGVNGAIPFIFIGNGGRNKGGALQRGFSTLPISGYLA